MSTADRALVEAIKRREARSYCRVCGTRLDSDRFCGCCGRVNTSNNRAAAPDLSEPRAAAQKETF